MPPPSVSPVIPTEPVSPNPVARPCASAASMYSRAVTPPSAHAHAVARAGVAPAANRDLQAGVGGEAHGPRDVAGVRHANDEGRTSIDCTGHDHAHRVVLGVVGGDDSAADRVAQPAHGL